MPGGLFVALGHDGFARGEEGAGEDHARGVEQISQPGHAPLGPRPSDQGDHHHGDHDNDADLAAAAAEAVSEKCEVMHDTLPSRG